jgi:SAM-dependent methyltransferase
MSWKKFLIIPRLVALTIRAPRKQDKAWELFWSRVRRTGKDGDALWDLGSEDELRGTLERVRAHLDPALPVLDVGCGNGRQTRALAGCFPRAVGVDFAPPAIARAREESAGISNIEFRVLDMSEPGAGRRLSKELGPMNAHIRGVLHIMPPDAVKRLVDNLHDLLGDKGSLYVVETDFEGDSLDYLEFQNAGAGSIPEPLRLVIASGCRPPAHFSEREMDAFFPSARWSRVASGPTTLHTLPMHNRDRGDMDVLTAYWAVVRPRAAG